MVLVHHHVKYKEIHGEDVVVLMEKGEHTKLHARLRKEGKCSIPSEKLHKISNVALFRRDNSRVMRFYWSNSDYRQKHIMRCKRYNFYHNKYLLRLRPDQLALL